MTQKEMHNFIRLVNPITYSSVQVIFQTGRIEIGFFTSEMEEFNFENKWRFVSNFNSTKYRETNSKSYSEIINGDLIKELRLL